MTVNEVYNSLGSFLLDLLPDKNWLKAELNIEIQPGVLGMSGDCLCDDEKISLRTRYNDELKSAIKWLHATTTEGGYNKWNKAKFTITPDNQFDMEFIWDQEWQDEVDRYNREEAEKDPNYTPPKWGWEK
jgi:hypothetical protein